MSKNAIYDKIGTSYDDTRKADPKIVEELINLLLPQLNGLYLDTGCGTGNYTNALTSHAYNLIGVDISQEMLSKAKNKYPNIDFRKEDIKQLSFPDNTFDGAICILATHHFGDLAQSFQELYRVIKGGNLVIFTSTPEQMKHYWLQEYFPEMMEQSINKMSSYSHLESTLKSAGFTSIKQKPFFITDTLQDCFLAAGKHSPEIYLDSKTRAGISSFHLSITQDELNNGLKRLEGDIITGRINHIIDSYEKNLGEYLFISAHKDFLD